MQLVLVNYQEMSGRFLISKVKLKVTAHGVPGLVSAQTDQVFAMMQSAKLEDSLGPFVRETCPSSEPAFILARERAIG